MTKKNYFWMIAIAGIMLFNGCEKDEAETPQTPAEEPIVPTGFSQIPDGGFETSWTNQVCDAGDYLEYQTAALFTLNSLHAFPASLHINGPVTAVRDENAHSGNYAMKLTTLLLQSGETSILIPGAAGTLNNTFISDFLQSGGNISVKKEYTDSPTALSGFYKYAPVSGDSASISVILYHDNEVVASGLLLEKNTIDSWTEFNVPIVYYNDAAPTHLEMIFSASAGYDFSDLQHCLGQVNSTLYLDDIQFELPAK